MIRPGDSVWIEDPDYGGTADALRNAGATLVPVRVNDRYRQLTCAREVGPRRLARAVLLRQHDLLGTVRRSPPPQAALLRA